MTRRVVCLHGGGPGLALLDINGVPYKLVPTTEVEDAWNAAFALAALEDRCEALKGAVRGIRDALREDAITYARPTLGTVQEIKRYIERVLGEVKP